MDKEIKYNLGQVPILFKSRQTAQETLMAIEDENLYMGTTEISKLDGITEALRSDLLQNAVGDNKVTLGIIKPHASSGRSLPDNDDEARDVLLGEIGRTNILFQFDYSMNEEQIEDFYRFVKDQYANIPTPRGDMIWDSLFSYTESGPITILLLEPERGNAVQWWRDRMGKTHPIEAEKNSIRGKYADEEMLPNNLVHGSGSVDEAVREVNLIADFLDHTRAKLENAKGKNLPDEVLLQELHFLPDDESFIYTTQVFDSKLRSESYIRGFRIGSVADRNLINRYLKEYTVVNFAGGSTEKAKEIYGKINHLEEVGLPQPRTYGRKGASLYRDFNRVDDTRDTVLALQKSEVLDDTNRRYLFQLVDIAAKLDNAGYVPLAFVHDLLFDGVKKKFYYIDPGSDLGYSSTTKNSNCIRQLISLFPRHAIYITEKYQEIVNH